jgi:hypothetical protein
MWLKKTCKSFFCVLLQKSYCPPGRPVYSVPSNNVVQPTETVKLLGVMLDHKLIFRNHVELAQRRGTKAVLALTRISSPTFGLPMPIRADSSSRS